MYNEVRQRIKDGVHSMAVKEKNLDIMQDKGAWQFTDELIFRIKRGEASAVAEFFNTNYNLLSRIASSFFWRAFSIHNADFTIDDLLNQLYVDIPFYRYSSRSVLYRDIIFGSFANVNDGGIKANRSDVKFSQCVSLDAPLTEDKPSDLSLLDLYITAPSAYDVIVANEELKDRELKDKAICEFLDRTVKNPNKRNALWCRLFTDLPFSHIRGCEYDEYKAIVFERS